MFECPFAPVHRRPVYPELEFHHFHDIQRCSSPPEKVMQHFLFASHLYFSMALVTKARVDTFIQQVFNVLRQCRWILGEASLTTCANLVMARFSFCRFNG